MTLTAGTRLGAHEIITLLGAGGMGEVYKARDTRLDRIVAIKVLSSQLAGDPAFRERFDRKARTISQLDHPHICALYDVGEQRAPRFSSYSTWKVRRWRIAWDGLKTVPYRSARRWRSRSTLRTLSLPRIAPGSSIAI